MHVWLVADTDNPVAGSPRFTRHTQAAQLTAQQQTAFEKWIERHKLFSLPGECSSTTNEQLSHASLAIRDGEREKIFTWPATRPCPELAAALKELPGLLGFNLAKEKNSDPTNEPAGLETTLAEILKPSKHVPFKSVVHDTTGQALIEFDTNNPAHVELKRLIASAATSAGKRAFEAGIFSARANEAGNAMEPYVRAALREAGLAARVPVTTGGNAQSTGYPDIEITGKLPCYLELKTYNATTVNTTQRSFYYSPSAQPKVTHDALHLLLAYELEKATRNGKTAFVPVHWKLITLQNLQVDLKFEFNQSNRGLYGNEQAVLADGEVDHGKLKR